MALTTSTAANAIREAYEPGFQELAFRNNSFLPLFEKIASPGDTSYRFKGNSAGNSSVETYSEGANMPTSGNQTWSNLAIAYTFFRYVVEVTGHAEAALKSQWLPAIEEEIRLGNKDLIDLITTTFIGSTSGLEVAIDSTSTYAGQARGSAAWWESTETAVSGALSYDDLIDLQEAIRDNDKGGMPSMILCPYNQESNIFRLTGGPAMQTLSPQDKASGLMNQAFGGIPVIPLYDFTNTVIAMLDNRPGKNSVVEHVPFTVTDQGRSGDADVFQIKWAGCWVNRIPKFDGKLTGVTA
jgi:hypothetical protein